MAVVPAFLPDCYVYVLSQLPGEEAAVVPAFLPVCYVYVLSQLPGEEAAVVPVFLPDCYVYVLSQLPGEEAAVVPVFLPDCYVYVLSQLPGEEAAVVPAFLLRLGPRPAGDPGTGQRPPHHPGSPAERLRQHQDRQVPRQELRNDPRRPLVGGGDR